MNTVSSVATSSKVALIVGFGPGISFAFAQALIVAGYAVAVAARNLEKLVPLANSIGAIPFQADAASTEQLTNLFNDVDERLGKPEVVLYNPSARVRGDFITIDPELVEQTLKVTAVGAFVVAQEAAKRMLPNKKGAIFFTGATAAVKGFPKSVTFAMGKFALRGLANSLAKELGPDGIHVTHFIIDGAVRDTGDETEFTAKNIATTYMAVLNQPPGAWSWEIELRSKDEKF